MYPTKFMPFKIPFAQPGACIADVVGLKQEFIEIELINQKLKALSFLFNLGTALMVAL
jgi:hypothetical protein